MDTLTPLPPTNREVDLPAFGSRIAKIRRDQRWSQRKLALHAGIRPERLSRLELGRAAEPRLREVVSLAHVLQQSLDALVFGSGDDDNLEAEAQAPTGVQGSGS